MPDSDKGGKKICPICDIEVDTANNICPGCGTDLSIFGDASGGDEEADLAALKESSQGSNSLDDILSLITDDKPEGDVSKSDADAKIQADLFGDKKEDAAKPAEEKKEIDILGMSSGAPASLATPASESKPEPAPSPAATPSPEPTPASKVKEPEPTPKPEAASSPPAPSTPPVPESSAPSTPSDSASPAAKPRGFQCPECSTMVEEDAKTCPGCGAIFEEDKEEAPATPAPTPSPESAPAPSPRPEPVSSPPAPATTPVSAPVTESKPGPKSEPKPEPAPRAKPEPIPLIPTAKPPEPTPARAQPTVPASKPESAAKKMRFECPECTTLVDEDAKVCPGCGAIFEDDEDEVPQTSAMASKPAAPTAPATAAPAKPAVQPVSAAAPPKSPPMPAKTDGITLYKHLSQLVAQTKPLLLISRKVGADVNVSKGYIDKAIVAGKSKDYKKAISFVEKSRDEAFKSLDASFLKILNEFKDEMDEAQKLGIAVATARPMLDSAFECLKTREYDRALKHRDDAKAEMSRTNSTLKDTFDLFNNIKELIANCKQVGVNTEEANSLFNQARDVAHQKHMSKAKELLKLVQDMLSSALPEKLQKAISDAGNDLREAKLAGINIARPISILKQASVLNKKKMHTDSLAQMHKFYKEMESIKKIMGK